MARRQALIALIIRHAYVENKCFALKAIYKSGKVV
jgi:hypothetical protein